MQLYAYCRSPRRCGRIANETVPLSFLEVFIVAFNSYIPLWKTRRTNSIANNERLWKGKVQTLNGRAFVLYSYNASIKARHLDLHYSVLSTYLLHYCRAILSLLSIRYSRFLQSCPQHYQPFANLPNHHLSMTTQILTLCLFAIQAAAIWPQPVQYTSGSTFLWLSPNVTFNYLPANATSAVRILLHTLLCLLTFGA